MFSPLREVIDTVLIKIESVCQALKKKVLKKTFQLFPDNDLINMDSTGIPATP